MSILANAFSSYQMRVEADFELKLAKGPKQSQRTIKFTILNT